MSQAARTRKALKARSLRKFPSCAFCSTHTPRKRATDDTRGQAACGGILDMCFGKWKVRKHQGFETATHAIRREGEGARQGKARRATRLQKGVESHPTLASPLGRVSGPTRHDVKARQKARHNMPLDTLKLATRSSSNNHSMRFHFYPRPISGMLVAITVMKSTLASSGKLAM